MNITTLSLPNETPKETIKRLHGANWAYHYHQWWLYNTEEGAKYRAEYSKDLKGAN